MNKDLSVKISIAGFICTLMVVYRHSLNYLAFFHSWSPQGLNGIVEDSCMRLTQIAVPYFFMVSGFFFLGDCNLHFLAHDVISKANEVTDKLNR